MKIVSHLAGALLGLLFLVFGLNFFFSFLEVPQPPEGSPQALFFGALFPTGYLAFIKLLEIVGGVCVAIPKSRTLGLLILGPIIVNILAYQIFLAKGEGLLSAPVVLATVLSLFLLWSERRPFIDFINREEY